MKTTPFLYRQGDVLIERIASIPDTAKRQPRNKRIILALGEATGHHHLLERETPDAADWWKQDGGEQFVTVKEPCELTHQEHAPITLPPGNYRVSIQREYSPEEIRNVRD